MAPQKPLNSQAPETQETGSALVINTQYLKDLTFESPNPLDFFQNNKSAPDINVEINIHVNTLSDNVYEVVLDIKAQAAQNEKKVFIIEVEYAGVFTLNGVEEQAVHPILMIECPRHLFPYVRHIVATVTREGGFPALTLNPIDFVDMYQQQLARVQETQDQAPKKLDS